jgi:hypothetical protein|tara:strand:+ start:482 stop:928 length:447 start_codon:yes stop_codon:yes gene_type:complete
MANHVRQQIRERVATTLTGLTTTGSKVYQSRVYPLAADNLPGLLVFTNSETSEPDQMGAQPELARELTLTIEGYAKGTANTDDTLDTISKEVETALAADTKINGLAKDIFLTGTDIQLSGEGDQPIGIVTMTFDVQYRTANNAPDVAL